MTRELHCTADWRADARVYRQHVARWRDAYRHGAPATQWAALAALADALLGRMADPDGTPSEATEVNLIDYAIEQELARQREAEDVELDKILGVDREPTG